MGDKGRHAPHSELIKREEHKVHHGNNDGYVPHHPEPGHGDNPHASQHKPDPECCYDTSSHKARMGLGEADDFRKMGHAHINSGTHSFYEGTRHVGGRLRNSGHKGAHRVGKR